MVRCGLTALLLLWSVLLYLVHLCSRSAVGAVCVVLSDMCINKYISTTGINPHDFKSNTVVAAKSLKTAGVKRPNTGHSVTVVATVNAAGVVLLPLFI